MHTHNHVTYAENKFVLKHKQIAADIEWELVGFFSVKVRL